MGISRFFRRSHWDTERARELDAYLAAETDENVARGMTPGNARAAARRKLGNTTLVREEIYQMNTFTIVDSAWRDLKHGVRLLRLNPVFAIVAVLSLSLGIGANTAIFELIDAVRLQTLPVANPQAIALIRLKDADGARGLFASWYPAMTHPVWERLRDTPGLPIEAFAWSPTDFDLSDSGRSRVTEGGLWVSGRYFSVLGVRAAAGRLIGPDDDRRGCAPAAVLGYAFWQRQFGGDPGVVGRTMSIERRKVPIVGVAESGFPGLEVGRSFDVALPVCAQAALGTSALDNGVIWWLTVMGRLQPGASIDALSARLAAVSPGIFDAVPANYPPESAAKYKTFSLVAEPAVNGVSLLREEYADSLWILLGIAGAVLLVASANLANLMLARASTRQREIAIRLAIGASRGRVIRQLLAESLLLAAIGAVLGAAIAGSLGRALIAYLGTNTSTVALHLDLNWRVFAFTTATAALCALLFGLTPAIRSTRVAAGEALRPGGRGLTADRQRFLLRRVLVVSQLALSLALVICAFQFVSTFRALATLDPGFRQKGIVEAALDYRSLRLPPERRASFREDLLGRVRAIPGVAAASDAMLLPISGGSRSNAVWLDGDVRVPDRTANLNAVGDRYFATLGIPMVAGRDFDPRRDVVGAPEVAIVNETFVRRFLKAGQPIGQRFWRERTASEPQTRYEVIGVVKDTKYRTLRSESPPIAYVAASQSAQPGESARLLVRSDAPAADVTAAIERTVAAIDPDIVMSFSVLQTRLRESLRREELMAALSGCFGGLAALLATIGLYGVLSYTVARRRNEIGIRMALGASRRDIAAMVVGEAAALIAVGIVVGAGLAIGVSSAASALLFGVRPGEPSSLLLAALCFSVVAAVATALPALSASRLQPSAAIREE